MQLRPQLFLRKVAWAVRGWRAQGEKIGSEGAEGNSLVWSLLVGNPQPVLWITR
eukprot:jgi/Psemu1/300074/fgenesh1_kg.6_\